MTRAMIIVAIVITLIFATASCGSVTGRSVGHDDTPARVLVAPHLHRPAVEP